MNFEREKSILEILIKEKEVTVKDMAKRLYASEPSIRRDLSSLEKQNMIKRTHGGAVLNENAYSNIKIPFLLRELEDADIKIKIAKKAVELVNDGDIIFLDASTSAYSMIPFLTLKRNITVITNGVKTLEKLSEYNINCIGTGGHIMNSCLAFINEYRIIESFNADICFFSCRGLSDNGILSDISEEENLIRQKMIKQSKKAYLLCSDNKIGKLFSHTLCLKNEISGIITDNE